MPRASSLQDLARLGEPVRDAVVLATFLAAVIAVVALAVVGLWRMAHAPPLARHLAVMSWRIHRSSVRTFAAAVADGDLEEAERLAGRAFGNRHRPPRRGRPTVASWDERVILDGTRPDAAAQLRRDGGLVAWCPGVRRAFDAGKELRDGDRLSVGRCHPLRLTVRSHRWFAADGVRCSADADGLLMVGQLTLRSIPACFPEALGARNDDAVEVWVHVEGPTGRRARRALRRVRRATRTGLH